MILFNRYKNTQVEKLDNDILKITSTMCDTFHEIDMVLYVDLNDTIIKEAKIQFIRQPDIICKETAKLADVLVGLSMGPGLTQKVKELLGGPSGCTHLMDLTLEAARAFMQGKFKMEFEVVGDHDKAKKELEKKLAGNCWFHTKHLR